MKRIFLTLAILATIGLGAAFALGMSIDDAKARTVAAQRDVGRHFLTGLGGLTFAALVHAIVLTYFMGTGRWLEETSRAYGLGDRWQGESRRLKHRTLPAMTGCLLLLIVTGAFGGAADPASPVDFQGWGGVSPATLHLMLATTTLGLNLLVYAWEYAAIDRNGRLVEEVVGEVRRIRAERGLPT